MKWATGLNSQMELLAKPGKGCLVPLLLSSSCVFNKIIFFLHITIKKQDKCGEENVRKLPATQTAQMQVFADVTKVSIIWTEQWRMQSCSTAALVQNCLSTAQKPSYPPLIHKLLATRTIKSYFNKTGNIVQRLRTAGFKN